MLKQAVPGAVGDAQNLRIVGCRSEKTKMDANISPTDLHINKEKTEVVTAALSSPKSDRRGGGMLIAINRNNNINNNTNNCEENKSSVQRQSGANNNNCDKSSPEIDKKTAGLSGTGVGVDCGAIRVVKIAGSDDSVPADTLIKSIANSEPHSRQLENSIRVKSATVTNSATIIGKNGLVANDGNSVSKSGGVSVRDSLAVIPGGDNVDDNNRIGETITSRSAVIIERLCDKVTEVCEIGQEEEGDGGGVASNQLAKIEQRIILGVEHVPEERKNFTFVDSNNNKNHVMDNLNDDMNGQKQEEEMIGGGETELDLIIDNVTTAVVADLIQVSNNTDAGVGGCDQKTKVVTEVDRSKIVELTPITDDVDGGGSVEADEKGKTMIPNPRHYYSCYYFLYGNNFEIGGKRVNFLMLEFRFRQIIMIGIYLCVILAFLSRHTGNEFWTRASPQNIHLCAPNCV